MTTKQACLPGTCQRKKNHVNPRQQISQLRNLAAAAQVDPATRALIGQDALDSQVTILPLPYWSTVRFRGIRAGAGPFTFATSVETRKAFAYKIGDDMQVAGFASGTAAQSNDTNLLAGGSQTNDNAAFVITGVGVEVVPGSEPELVKAIMRECALSLSLSGTNRQLLGPIARFPQPGGIFGQQCSTLSSEDGAGGTPAGQLNGVLQNGNPQAGNLYKLGQFPLRWNAVGSGKKDTSLVISFDLGAAITLAGEATAGVYTAPAEIFADFRVHLHGIQISKRSSNI